MKERVCPNCPAEAGSGGGDSDRDGAQRLLGAFIRVKRQQRLMREAGGLPQHEFHLLHNLRALCCGNSSGPRASELAARLGVSRPTVAQQVGALERRGLVERRREDGDRRSVRVLLSPAGSELLERHRSAVLESFRELAARLGPERTELFSELLEETAAFLEAEA